MESMSQVTKEAKPEKESKEAAHAAPAPEALAIAMAEEAKEQPAEAPAAEQPAEPEQAAHPAPSLGRHPLLCASGFQMEDDSLFQWKLQGPIHWSVGWADLMTTMFVLFALLYLFETVQREVMDQRGNASQSENAASSGNIPSPARTETGEETTSVIYDLSKQALAEEELAQIASVELAPDKAVRIILTGDVLFDLGKAEIKPPAKKSLQKIAEVLRKGNHVVNVVGHTDDLPVRSERFPSNWELSAYRAAVVARFLIDDMKIPADRFFVSGNSSYVPRVPNDSPGNRASNRRVEIVISEKKPIAAYDTTQTLQEGR